MIISGAHTGGNIKLCSIYGDTVTLDNELRDTKERWFYWSFCCEGAAGKTLRFDFQHHNMIGYYGPAVSYDLVNWHWLGCRNDDNSFTYTFKENENKVYFAHNMMYLPDRFYSFASDNGIEVKTLCTSEKGNNVPYVKLGNGKRNVILTSRHHACEATGNYVLEGILCELNRSLPNDVSVFCVPFVDYDGVVCGDQGKSRFPHDHNRDYCDIPIYKSTKCIQSFVKENGVYLGFDFHSPWHCGGRNDAVFIVEQPNMKNEITKFSDLLISQLTNDALKYDGNDNIAPDTEWNRSDNPNYASYMRKNGAALSFTLETAYFGREDNIFSQQKAVTLGKCFAKALRKYIEK